MLQLKELRKQKCVTQQQIAEFLGVSRPTYTRYEIGEREPSLEVIEKLADFFEVSIDRLFGYKSIHTAPVKTTAIGFQLEGLDVDLYESSHSLSDEDKVNLMRYIDFIKKRNQA